MKQSAASNQMAQKQLRIDQQKWKSKQKNAVDLMLEAAKTKGGSGGYYQSNNNLVAKMTGGGVKSYNHRMFKMMGNKEDSQKPPEVHKILNFMDELDMDESNFPDMLMPESSIMVDEDQQFVDELFLEEENQDFLPMIENIADDSILDVE